MSNSKQRPIAVFFDLCRWDYFDCCDARTVSEWRLLCVQCHLCQIQTETILNRLSEMGRRMFLVDDQEMEPFCEMIAEDFPPWYSDHDKSLIIPICSRDVLLCTLREILRKDYKSVPVICSLDYCRCSICVLFDNE